MQSVFEKIIKDLGKRAKFHMEFSKAKNIIRENRVEHLKQFSCYQDAIEIVKQAEAEYNGGWISCGKEMPPVETEVFVLAKRKFKDGTFNYIRTMAMYEDGTISECDSCWYWEDIEGEYDEENDCYIIPKGWWESRKYNTKDSLNFAVDDEVIAWQPLPDPYQTNICDASDCPINDGIECPAAEGCAEGRVRSMKDGIHGSCAAQGWNCPKYRKKQTNADRIRSMSDEELTKIILCPYDTAGKPIEIMPCVRDGNVQELIPPEDCKKCMMEWLNSEAEG